MSPLLGTLTLVTTITPQLYRWSIDQYLALSETGTFGDRRVELVNGDLWTMTPLGAWHGRATFRLARLLWADDVIVTDESLAIGTDSLPDPDVWVLAAAAEPVGRHGDRVNVYDPRDVVLVVEVSDTTRSADLGVKARLYAAAGFGCYWVVTPNGLHVHTEAGPKGYAAVATHQAGTSVSYRGRELSVAEILG